MIETKRLILRPWLDSDAPALYELARDPRVGPAACWPPHESVEQSLDILRHVLRGPEQYAITLKDGRATGDGIPADGTLVGAIGLKGPEQCPYLTSPHAYAVGYWVGVPFWGRGYAPEALDALIEHARTQLGATSIWADHLDSNTQSHRVMEKCGMRVVGHMDEAEAARMGASRPLTIMRRDL